jgi:hypothetical protein
MCIDLNWNPTTALDTFSQNDSGIFSWCESSNASASNQMAFGASNASSQGSYMNVRTPTNIIQGASSGVNTNIGSSGTTNDAKGLTVIRRNNATQILTYKNGGSDGLKTFTSSSNSGALVNLNFHAMCRNSNGTDTLFDNRIFSMQGITRGYVDPAILYSAFLTFKS